MVQICRSSFVGRRSSIFRFVSLSIGRPFGRCIGWWLGMWAGGWVGGWMCGWVGEWVNGWVGGWVGGSPSYSGKHLSFVHSIVLILFTVAYNSVISLDANRGTVPCFANVSDNLVCTYRWMKSEGGHDIQDGATLDLSAPHVLPGDYQCIADCSINGHRCRVSATKVHYTRIEDLKQSNYAFLEGIFPGFDIIIIILFLLIFIDEMLLCSHLHHIYPWT